MDQRVAAGDYFRAMEIPLRSGRLFNEQDTATSPRVMIADERMVQQLWPTSDPLGKRVRMGGIDAASTAPWPARAGRVRREAAELAWRYVRRLGRMVRATLAPNAP